MCRFTPSISGRKVTFEVLTGTPFDIKDKSIWANGSRYYINNKSHMLNSKVYKYVNTSTVIQKMNDNKEANTYEYFNEFIEKFIQANQDRLNYLKNEAYSFI